MIQNLSQIDAEQAPLSWQAQLQDVITDVDELCSILGLSSDCLKISRKGEHPFKFKVPRGFVARMTPGDAQDPLLRQIIALDDEFTEVPGFQNDPLAERASNPVPGLLHKYNGRVLLLVTGTCSVNCRYCFRREFPYEKNNPGMLGWQKAIQAIQADESIHEVILSGGDPLVASDKLLVRLAEQLNAIPHLKILRIHTRLPVMIPARVTDSFIEWFTNLRLKPVMVIHANHARELDADVLAACSRLKAAGVTMLNQTVLLKGVNDRADTLDD